MTAESAPDWVHGRNLCSRMRYFVQREEVDVWRPSLFRSLLVTVAVFEKLRTNNVQPKQSGSWSEANYKQTTDMNIPARNMAFGRWIL